MNLYCNALFIYSCLFLVIILVAILVQGYTKRRIIDFFRLNKFTKNYKVRAKDLTYEEAVSMLLTKFKDKYGEPSDKPFDSDVKMINGCSIKFETNTVVKNSNGLGYLTVRAFSFYGLFSKVKSAYLIIIEDDIKGFNTKHNAYLQRRGELTKDQLLYIVQRLL